jgi:Fuc2NAc and GlcNAc transferase
MGDAGSGFLGLMFAALSIQAAQRAPQLFWCWLILLGVFIVDATATLFRRLARRENISIAHRSHAYQNAAARWAAHRPVVIAVAAINVVWLFPLAWLVSRGTLGGKAGVAIAYTPLLAVAAWLGAGRSVAPAGKCPKKKEEG